MIVSLQLAGLLLILNGFGHVALPRALAWKAAFDSRLTKQISYLHVYFIGLTCVTWGVFAMFATPDLVSGGRLANLVLASGAMFCTSRLLAQFALDSTLWNTRRLGRTVFVLSAAWWSAESAAFIWPLVNQLGV